MPAVSVLLPAYNGLPFLRAACASVLAQTLGDFELIALDDASTDGTGEYLDGLAARDSRVRVLHLPKAGYAVNLNLGLEAATAPLVARMDADDICRPTRLAEQAAFLGAHPEVAAVGCQCAVIDRDGRETGKLVYETDPGAVAYRLLTDTPLPHPGSMFRTAAARAVGGYDPTLVPAEDYRFWVRMREHGRLANLPATLLEYRVHGANISAARRDEQRGHADRISREHLTATGFAGTESQADRFRAAVLGDPQSLDATGAAAVRAVWERFVAVEGGRHRLRWEAFTRMGKCRKFSAAWVRWLRLGRRIDPTGAGVRAAAGKLRRALGLGAR